MISTHNPARTRPRLAINLTAALLLSGWLPPDYGGRSASAADNAVTNRAYSLWSNVGRAELSDTQPVEVGVKFRTTVDGNITAIRFYRHVPIPSGYTVHVWSGTGELLGSGASFEGQQPTPGWQIVEVYPPAPIKANQTYVASYYASQGQYTVTENFFDGAVIRNGPLKAPMNRGVSGGNGVYVYSPGGGFPNQTYKGSNYWVDVVFRPAAPR
jgi:hypothetical protein